MKSVLLLVFVIYFAFEGHATPGLFNGGHLPTGPDYNSQHLSPPGSHSRESTHQILKRLQREVKELHIRVDELWAHNHHGNDGYHPEPNPHGLHDSHYRGASEPASAGY